MRVTAIIRFKNSALYEARKRLGLSQAEMAEEIGCTLAALQGWESFLNYPFTHEVISQTGGRGRKNRENEIFSLECLTGMSYDELFPEEYRSAVDKKLGRTVEVVGEMAALPEWAGEERMLESPEDIYIREEEKDKLHEIIEMLNGREKKIIEMRMDGLTFDEIGDSMYISGGRVQQIENQAKRKLRMRLRKEGYGHIPVPTLLTQDPPPKRGPCLGCRHYWEKKEEKEIIEFIDALREKGWFEHAEYIKSKSIFNCNLKHEYDDNINKECPDWEGN